MGVNVHYYAQLRRHKQLSYLLKSSHKIENYNMCELSAELFDFVVIFNLDKKLSQPANVNVVLKFKL